jgi:hypothetical protein
MAKIAMVLSQPPRRTISLVHDMVFRFNCLTVQNAAAYTRAQLLSLLVFGQGSTTNYRLIQAIRVKKIELWDPANGTSTPDTHANITWLGAQSQRRVFDDASVGTSQAAYISTVPPKDSTANFVTWQSGFETEALFGISCGVGAVLDLHCTVTVASDFNSAMSTVATTATSTLGVIYFNNLDGTSAGMRPSVELNRIT